MSQEQGIRRAVIRTHHEQLVRNFIVQRTIDCIHFKLPEQQLLSGANFYFCIAGIRVLTEDTNTFSLFTSLPMHLFAFVQTRMFVVSSTKGSDQPYNAVGFQNVYIPLITKKIVMMHSEHYPLHSAKER
jgi:hypothetical protein